MPTTLLTSSVAKKCGMALSGLMLYGFLVGHVSGNFLLLKGDGGEAFNAYSDFLINHPLLIPIELGLVAVFLIHVWLAVVVSRENRQARPQGYAKTESVGARSLASRTMIWTGLLILVFVVLHLKTFKYGDRADGTLFDLVIDTFHQPLYVAWYVVAMTVLGFHLCHALQSAFQTLGLSARQNLRRASIVLCFAIASGFGVIPLFVFFDM